MYVPYFKKWQLVLDSDTSKYYAHKVFSNRKGVVKLQKTSQRNPTWAGQMTGWFPLFPKQGHGQRKKSAQCRVWAL